MLLSESDLTDTEQALIESLPTLPIIAKSQTSNIWIIEWLSPGESQTGQKLHEWMKAQRPRWSRYQYCKTKVDVIQSIERATHYSQQSGMIPVLHFEAHGNEFGLAPSRENTEFLTWEELTIPLQELNLATRCNLVVVVAACVGFAGIKAFQKGPRAPAVALVGPEANLGASELLLGTKEFYRRLMHDENPRLLDMVESASRETGIVSFIPEPFATLFYEATVEYLVKSMRPTEREEHTKRLRHRMVSETDLSPSEIENRLAQLPAIPNWTELQHVWDKMFMIDLYPINRERFGIDMKEIVERIEKGSVS